MALIHTHIPKRKPRKPNAKQRELAADWEKLLKKYETKTVTSAKAKTLTQTKPFILETGYHDCSKKKQQTYTGTKMIGIGTLHKSNAVPVFSEEDAVEISRMRRG